MSRLFHVEVFGSPGDRGDLHVADSGVYKFERCPGRTDAPISGYVEDDSNCPSFLVALRSVDVDGRSIPDWSGEKLLGLDGKVYRDKEVHSIKVADRLLFRQLQIEAGGTNLRHSYRVGWRDCLIPPDPMMPWGRDFYKYVAYQLR